MIIAYQVIVLHATPQEERWWLGASCRDGRSVLRPYIADASLRSRGSGAVRSIDPHVLRREVTGPVAGHGFARVQIYDPLGRSNSVAAVTGEKALQVGKDFLLQYWNLSR